MVLKGREELNSCAKCMGVTFGDDRLKFTESYWYKNHAHLYK